MTTSVLIPLILGILVLLLAAGLVVLLLYTRKLRRRTQELTAVLGRILEGDFDVVLSEFQETGSTANLSEVLSRVGEHIVAEEEIFTTLSELAVGVKRMSEEQVAAIQEQYNQVAEFRSSVTRLESNVRDQGRHIERVSSHLTEYNKTLQKINTDMQEVAGSLRESEQTVTNISDKFSNASQAMQVIFEQNRNVADFLTAIEDISDRTNLLSLNASIEAARAGDSGRGFAVVANEVGRLAEQTATTVGTIKKLLGDTRDVVEGEISSVQAALSSIGDIVSRAAEVEGSTQELILSFQEQTNSLRGLTPEISGLVDLSLQLGTVTGQQESGITVVEKQCGQVLANAQDITERCTDLARNASRLLGRSDDLRSTMYGRLPALARQIKTEDQESRN